MHPSNSWSWRRGELDVWNRSEKVIRTVAKLMMLEFSNMVRKKGLKYLFIFVCANLLLLCQISRKFLLADHFWPIWGAPPPPLQKKSSKQYLTKKHEINLILDPTSYIPWKEFWEKKNGGDLLFGPLVAICSFPSRPWFPLSTIATSLLVSLKTPFSTSIIFDSIV